MRRLVIGFGLGLVLLASGCHFMDRFRRDEPSTVNVPKGPVPPATQLVAYLNDNAHRVQAVQSLRVSIDAKQGGQQPVGLEGRLVCQKPRNFRLKANILGNPGVDIGSNDQEFWFWTSQERPAYVMHCNYQDLQRREVKLPIPFQPDMIVCALGIAEYDESKSYEVRPGRNNTLELIEPVVLPSGARARKVTVFSAIEMRPPKPQVLAHVLQDEKGKEICSAYITEVAIDRATNGVLPSMVRLSYPAEKMEMTMRLRDMQSIQVEPARAAKLFTRNDLSTFPGFDLATGKPDRPEGMSQGSSFQRVGGSTPNRGW